LLGARAAAQEEPPAQEEEPPPLIQPERPALPERPAFPEHERPATGQPDPAAGREQQQRAPVEPSAGLQQERPVMVQIGGSVAWDSNLLRLAEPQSERIRTAYVGLRVDKLYAQQRWFLDLTQTAYRYDKFSYLDFDALNYRGGWAWHLSPRVSGTLTAERRESLANYGDFRIASQRNVRTAGRELLSVDARWFGGWHLLGGIGREQTRFTVPFPQEGSYRARRGEAGVMYEARSGNRVTVKLLSLDADYVDRVLDPVNLLDEGFRRHESELSATWRITARSSFDARLARVEHRSRQFTQRDFSGTAGRLGYRWTPTARLSLELARTRALDPWSDLFASYRVEDRLSLDGAWQIGARMALRASLSRTQYDYRNPPFPLPGAARSDSVRSVQLAAEWRVLRNALLNARLQRYRQISSEPGARFEGTVATLDGTLLF
jgi:exopolysaccharide biosynthesis operon protein EpsL